VLGVTPRRELRVGPYDAAEGVRGAAAVRPIHAWRVRGVARLGRLGVLDAQAGLRRGEAPAGVADAPAGGSYGGWGRRGRRGRRILRLGMGFDIGNECPAHNEENEGNRSMPHLRWRFARDQSARLLESLRNHCELGFGGQSIYLFWAVGHEKSAQVGV
jgi:hypothetical protein